MKNKNILLILVLTFTLAGCGNKDENKSGGVSADPYTISTVEGRIQLQRPIVEIGGQSYQISYQSYQTISMAVQQAQSQNIQPFVENGVQKYSATITGSLATGYVQPGMPQQQPGQNLYNISQAVIHR